MSIISPYTHNIPFRFWMSWNLVAAKVLIPLQKTLRTFFIFSSLGSFSYYNATLLEYVSDLD